MTEPKERTDVLVCFGTRPEVIKLSSVIESLAAEGILFKTLFTGQHDELFEDVAHLLPRAPCSIGHHAKRAVARGCNAARHG